MKGDDFTISFTVSQSPEEVFQAINNVRGWWGGGIVGNTDKVGDIFRYKHKTFHVSTQKITELVPGKKVVWHIQDGLINFVKNKSEWDGTDIVFEIDQKDNRTTVNLTHIGLTPKLECFEDCSGGWKHYFGGSLKKLITTGSGEPDPKEYSEE